jgi:galactose mutarotase-like enzyme
MPQHGFARDCRWSVVDQGASAATFELRDSAATRTNYPFSFRQGLTYRLQRGRLHWEQVIENLSHEAMPFSTGFHPYFAAPLTPTGKRAACYIRMPEATLVTMHGRGERFTSSPLPARNWSVATDVSATMFIADLKSPELVMVDPISQLEVAFNFEDAVAHRFVAMWAKSPSEPYYCLEPWTALPNSFSRHEDGELSVLPPGGVFRAGFWMELRPSGTIAPEEQRG